MKNITKDYYEETPVEEKVDSLHRIVLAVVVTGFLYFLNLGSKLPENTPAVSETSEASVALSPGTADRVLTDVSAQSGLPKTALHIVEAQPQTESDVCVAIVDSQVCRKAIASAMQITVKAREQRWVYRLNTSGSRVELQKVIPSEGN